VAIPTTTANDSVEIDLHQLVTIVHAAYRNQPIHLANNFQRPDFTGFTFETKIEVTPEEAIEEPESPIIEISEVQAQFIAGWRHGGGIEAELPLVLCIIYEETRWQVEAINKAGPFFGLGQFLWSTWESVGGGEWADPYTQGRNFARNRTQSGYENQWPQAYANCIGE